MIDEPFTYLAVAESRQFFASITPYMLSKCTQELYTVCPSDMMLRTVREPNCLTALFLGKADIVFSKCKRLIVNETFEPVWIRSPDASYWIYSLSIPQRVTVQCHEMGSPPNSAANYQIQLEGTGVLPNSSFCYVHAENFKLLHHSLGKTTVTLTKTHIVLANIGKILHFTEEVVLQPNGDPTKELHRLDEIRERAASQSHMKGIDITRVVATFEDAELPHRSLHWIWFVGLAILFIAIGLLWSLWFKPIQNCCQHIHQHVATHHQQPNDLATQQMNSLGIELQVLGQSETKTASTERPSKEDDKESPTTPTVFVRRGRVIDG